MSFYKYVNGKVSLAPRNGVFDGKAMSNLTQYLEENEALANSFGYYELVQPETVPNYNEKTQYLKPTYSLVGNKLNVTYEVTPIT